MDLDKKVGIKENLIAEVGRPEAEIIWNRAKVILKEIEARYPDLPKGQRMHAGFIFPAAAVQIAIKEIRGDQELGYRVISGSSSSEGRQNPRIQNNICKDVGSCQQKDVRTGCRIPKCLLPEKEGRVQDGHNSVSVQPIFHGARDS